MDRPPRFRLPRAAIFSLTLLLSLVLGGSAGASPVKWPAERFPGWLLAKVIGIATWQLLGIFLLILFALILRRLAVYVITAYMRRLAQRISETVDKAIGRAAQPISGLVMALVFGLGFPLLGFSKGVDAIVAIAVRLLAVSSSVWLFYRQIDVLSDVMTRKAEKTETRLDDQLVPLVRRTLKAFAVVIGGIFILQNLRIDVASLVAGLGLGGLAFALAAKDTLANLFGSLVIFIDRPFQIGDWVCIEKTHGTVEDVGFRTTKIRTFYNSLVTVPNAKLTATMIDNYGARIYRRIKVKLSLTYSTTPAQMQAFVEALRAVVAAHPVTRKDYYEIHFNDFGAYSLDVLFYVFVKVPSWSDELKARHDLFLSAMRIAEELGVEFAFPTQTLHLDSMSQTTPRVVGGSAPPSEAQLQEIIRAYGPGGAKANPSFGLTHGFLPGHDIDRGVSEGAKDDVSEGG
ncbi:MAG: mechanosensitive ion channel family protein [Deltaproteobacteria bacterium]|nr:mechanosensitive ion channel family protein [Deltaproteobacteria bacterium]